METLVTTEELVGWLMDTGLSIVGIIAGVLVVDRVVHYFVEKIVRRTIKGDPNLSKRAEEKREDTLIHVFTKTTHVLLWIIGGMMVISELGVDIGPLLAAAGVAGIALGFGGQYLIRDVISGLFILLENQYRVGDVVCVGDTCGLVESINLRLTVMRDLDGTVHHIPNGEVHISSNLTKAFARVHLDVGVSYDADLDHVIGVINGVGQELAEDPEWKEKVKEAPAFLRVNDFGDSAIMIKILGESEAGEQWAVTGEFRKRLKIAFDREGIEIPFPQRVMHAK